MSLNINLQAFHTAVVGYKDDQRMTYVGDKPAAGAKSAGIFGRDKQITVAGKTTTQAQENNAVRTALLNALKDQFGVKLPPSVQKALVGSGVFGGGDMKTDDRGSVISGRPLTARRIRAVLTAAAAEVAKNAPVDNTPYYAGDLSAPGATISKDKIRARLDAMSATVPNRRYRNPVTEHVVQSFVTLITNARNAGRYGEDMVAFITNAVRRRNKSATGSPDQAWFMGVTDTGTARLERDIRRFLNLDNAHGEYWQDPAATVERELREFEAQQTREEVNDNPRVADSAAHSAANPPPPANQIDINAR